MSKRIFDFILALMLAILLSPLLLIISLSIAITDGRPVFFVSERMQSINKGFRLFKFRTMTEVKADSGVTSSAKSSRITFIGKFLRKYRLDELPQLFNILVGQMSFIGPRPPVRMYVERFPKVYKKVLATKPGVSGIASIYFHKREEQILNKCTTESEADDAYSRLCIPRKAKLDLIYQNNQSFCYDIKLLFLTIRKVFL